MALDQRPVTLSLAPDVGAQREEPERPPEAMPLGSAPSLVDVSRATTEADSVGEVAAEITTEIVGLLRRRTGRGPTKAKTTISSDLVLVTMADCYTALERQLAAVGNEELVVLGRRAVHSAMRAEASAIVEAFTDKQVTAYLTAQQDAPEIAILVFYLAPFPPRAV